MRTLSLKNSLECIFSEKRSISLGKLDDIIFSGAGQVHFAAQRQWENNTILVEKNKNYGDRNNVNIIARKWDTKWKCYEWHVN